MFVFSVEPTSTWIPLSLLGVLSAYMVHLFLKERREAAFAGAEGVEAISMEPPVMPGAAHAPMPAAMPAASEPAPAKKKRRLLWRTAWLWLPFVAGFAGQAWFDIIGPMVEKAQTF